MHEKKDHPSVDPLLSLAQAVDALRRAVAEQRSPSLLADPLSWSDERLCTRIEASLLARALGFPVSVWHLDRLAVTGGGPPITYFNKKPLYRVRELKAWLASRTSAARSTAELKRANNAKAMRGGRDE